MSLKRHHTEQPVHVGKLNAFLDLERYKISFIQFNKRPHEQKLKNKQSINHSPSLSSMLDKSIKQENIRLVTKIFQISQRKNPFNNTSQISVSGKKYNPEKSRDIILENKRLGKSLVRIKTGKPLEKVKTEMVEKQRDGLGKYIFSSRTQKKRSRHLLTEQSKSNIQFSKSKKSSNKMSLLTLHSTQELPKSKIFKLSQLLGYKNVKK